MGRAADGDDAAGHRERGNQVKVRGEEPSPLSFISPTGPVLPTGDGEGPGGVDGFGLSGCLDCLSERHRGLSPKFLVRQINRPAPSLADNNTQSERRKLLQVQFGT